MSRTIFKFRDKDGLDIQLCANRNKLYCAISELDDLLRELVNDKTYEHRYMYPIGVGKNEFGQDITEYSTIDSNPDNMELNMVSFIPTDYVERRIKDILEDVEHLLW